LPCSLGRDQVISGKRKPKMEKLQPRIGEFGITNVIEVKAKSKIAK